MKELYNSRELLNDVLRNINSDIALIKKDFKKLNDIVLVLNIKVKETQKFKNDLESILLQINDLSQKIIDLVTAKNELSNIIVQVDKDRRSTDEIYDLTFNTITDSIENKIIEIKQNIIILKKLIGIIAIVLGITIYATNSTESVLNIVFHFLKKLISF